MVNRFSQHDKATLMAQLLPNRPVLIAGPTASGKSALALEIAQSLGGVIVNADALQVYNNWRILTARPNAVAEALVPHHLYGHVDKDTPYSVGHWLREVDALLKRPERAIIVGGTGLYFTALTQGLAEIPLTPSAVRAEADARVARGETAQMLSELDADTVARIDSANPARIQRAWEVQATTGQGLAAWHDATPPPILRLEDAHPLLLDADRDWLATRISTRFDAMIAQGAIDEVRHNLEIGWTPSAPSSKAIGAPELVDYLKGNRCLKDAVDAGKAATRQFAKRQRTWFRSKMTHWMTLGLP